MHTLAVFAAAQPREWREIVQALRRLHAEEVLLPVLVQLVVIILAARLFAQPVSPIGPAGRGRRDRGGLVLGPSVLGYFFPGVAAAIFHPQWHASSVPPELFDATLHWIFTAFSQVGLILLLFLVGLEFDFSHLRRERQGGVVDLGRGDRACRSRWGRAWPWCCTRGWSRIRSANACPT